MDTPQSAQSAAPAKKSNKKLLFIVAGIFVLALILVAVLLVMMSQQAQQKTTATGNSSSAQSSVSSSETVSLAPGQTNPNIVGFGQTFDCEPRSDQEYYRTDETFVIDPKNPSVMYINAEYKGFHKSIDGGKTWTLLTNGIKAYGRKDDPNKPCYAEYPYALIDPSNSSRVILAVSGAGGTPKDLNALSSGILESTDGGQSFNQMIRDDMNGYVSSITFDPTDPSILYYGTNSSPASYMEADPNKIFVKTGLVHKYQSGVWTELPTSFNPYTGATGVHVNPANPKEIVVFTMSAPKPQGGQRSVEGAAQMGILRTTDGGQTWKATHPLPSGYEAVLTHAVAANFQNMFATPFTQGTSSPKSFYSTDGGKTFKQSGKFMDYITYDPNNSNRLLGYAWQVQGPVSNKLFESTDAGATWHEFASLPSEIKNIGDKKTLISNIVWHPTDKNTFYMSAASALLWKTTDNGKTWTKLLDYTML
jgi:photosystem II stability/assembly factor-like uncharacterized protein